MRPTGTWPAVRRTALRIWRALPLPAWLSLGVWLCWGALFLTVVERPQPYALPPDPGSAALVANGPWHSPQQLLPAALLHQLPRDADTPALVPETGHWVDHSRQAGLGEAREQLQAGAFEHLPRLRSQGLSQTAHWFVVRARYQPDAVAQPPGAASAFSALADAGDNAWLLQVGAPYLNDVRVWVEHRDGRLSALQLGDHFLNSQRPVRARLHVAPFTLAPGEEVLLWVRVQSSSVLNVSLALSRPGAFFAHESRFNALMGMLLGLLALAAVSYTLLGAWLRDRIMLAYALLVSSQLLLFTGNTGMLMQLVREAPWWLSDLFNGVGTLGPLFAALVLWIYILDMREHYPRLARLHAGVAFVVLCLLPLTITAHYGALLKPSYQIAVWITPLNLVLAWRAWRRVADPLRLAYLVAFVVFIAGVGTTVFMLTGSFPVNDLTLHIYPISAVVHSLVMAYAMALRVTQLHTDKLRAEGRAQDHRRFVALLTHEFRNPLASIDRSANFLQAAGGTLAEPVQARLGNIRHQVRRLGDLVTGFLRVGDPQEGRLQPQPRPVDLRQLCQALHESLDPDMRSRVRLVLPPGTVEAHLDPTLMELALSNLLDNALRYSPDDGQAELALALRPDSLTGRGSHAHVRITDSGPGLPSAELAQLGQPYYRGSSSLGTQGTGLGYHFSRRIIEAHGGQLIARSARPHGLHVTARLPLPSAPTH